MGAFITKAEFDSALSDFNARLTTFEAGINSKIDSQVTSYLDRNGIWNGKKLEPENKTIAGANYGVCAIWWHNDSSAKTVYIPKSTGYTPATSFSWNTVSAYMCDLKSAPSTWGSTFCLNVPKSGLYVGQIAVMPIYTTSTYNTGEKAWNTDMIIYLSGNTDYRVKYQNILDFDDLQNQRFYGINQTYGYSYYGWNWISGSSSTMPQWSNVCVESAYIALTTNPLSIKTNAGSTKYTFDTSDFYRTRTDLILGAFIQPYNADMPLKNYNTQFFVSKYDTLFIDPVRFEDYRYTGGTPANLEWHIYGKQYTTIGYLIFIKDAAIY